MRLLCHEDISPPERDLISACTFPDWQLISNSADLTHARDDFQGAICVPVMKLTINSFESQRLSLKIEIGKIVRSIVFKLNMQALANYRKQRHSGEKTVISMHEGDSCIFSGNKSCGQLNS